jgi:hypothetical protein
VAILSQVENCTLSPSSACDSSDSGFSRTSCTSGVPPEAKGLPNVVVMYERSSAPGTCSSAISGYSFSSPDCFLGRQGFMRILCGDYGSFFVIVPNCTTVDYMPFLMLSAGPGCTSTPGFLTPPSDAMLTCQDPTNCAACTKQKKMVSRDVNDNRTPNPPVSRSNAVIV